MAYEESTAWFRVQHCLKPLMLSKRKKIGKIEICKKRNSTKKQAQIRGKPQGWQHCSEYWYIL